jgi:hypothetical protein
VRDQALLDIYLSDHFAGATAGVELARRMAGAGNGSDELARIADEIEADRGNLRDVMSATGVEQPRLKIAIGWLSEKLGRLKLNDRVFGRSPLSEVIELESLIAGVSGKLQLWRALAVVASRDSRLKRFDFEAMAGRAEDQRLRLERLHDEAVRAA